MPAITRHPPANPRSAAVRGIGAVPTLATLATIAACAPLQSPPQGTAMTTSSAAATNPPHANGALDFAFQTGHWRIQNKRLKKRLAGSTDWESFEAIAEARPLPHGFGNVDTFVAEQWRPGFVGVTIRIFSPETKKWSIYWLDNKTGGLDRSGHLTVPVVGAFNDNIGTFLCDDTFEGKPIIVRYIWTVHSRDSARWEQAFSPDGGKTWETNWIMDQTRIGE